MNYKTMETETLGRILKQVSDELKNRECKDEATFAQVLMGKLQADLEAIDNDFDREPKNVKAFSRLKSLIEEMTIAVEEYWKETQKND